MYNNFLLYKTFMC